MNARALAAGAALALLLPAPVARSEGEDDAGAACSFVTTLEEQPPQPPEEEEPPKEEQGGEEQGGEEEPRVRYSGRMTAGPWVLTSPDGTVVSIACSVQADSDDPDAPDLFSVRSAGAYMPPTPIEFETPSWETEVFLCTEVVVNDPPNPPNEPRRYDDNPDKPGPQCQKAERRDGSLFVVEVAPYGLDSYVCVQVGYDSSLLYVDLERVPIPIPRPIPRPIPIPRPEGVCNPLNP